MNQRTWWLRLLHLCFLFVLLLVQLQLRGGYTIMMTPLVSLGGTREFFSSTAAPSATSQARSYRAATRAILLKFSNRDGEVKKGVHFPHLYEHVEDSFIPSLILKCMIPCMCRYVCNREWFWIRYLPTAYHPSVLFSTSLQFRARLRNPHTPSSVASYRRLIFFLFYSTFHTKSNVLRMV